MAENTKFSIEYKQTLAALRYIADSPAPDHGGFHPNTVEIAKDAIALIKELQAQIDDFTDKRTAGEI